jgi:hypothetical protein
MHRRLNFKQDKLALKYDLARRIIHIFMTYGNCKSGLGSGTGNDYSGSCSNLTKEIRIQPVLPLDSGFINRFLSNTAAKKMEPRKEHRKV